MSSGKKYFLILLIFSLLLLSGCNIKEMGEAVNPEDTNMVVFEVESGMGTKSIASKLQESGLIKSDWAFVNLVKERGLDGKLQAGKYQLSPSMSLTQVVDKIGNAEVYRDIVKVTIPEGYEFDMIVEKLVEANLIDEDVFRDLAQISDLSKYRFMSETPQRDFFVGESDKIADGKSLGHRLEGYLFPATYSFEKGVSEEDILYAMLDKFDSVFKPEYYDRAKELNMSINDVITLASIIEREGASAEEFPIISSVFHNRMRSSMLLQSCASVQYIIGERKPVLLNSDIAIKSDYNTYINAGLPPTPIASPGELAIKSALYPETTDYLYFVVSGQNDGKHIFSKTLEEHNKAVKKALKGQ